MSNKINWKLAGWIIMTLLVIAVAVVVGDYLIDNYQVYVREKATLQVIANMFGGIETYCDYDSYLGWLFTR